MYTGYTSWTDGGPSGVGVTRAAALAAVVLIVVGAGAVARTGPGGPDAFKASTLAQRVMPHAVWFEAGRLLFS